MRLYGESAARRLSQCQGLLNTRSGARKVRAPGKDPLMLLGLLGEFLVAFFWFLLHPGSFFDSCGAVAVFRYALLARYRFNGRKSQGKYGEIWAPGGRRSHRQLGWQTAGACHAKKCARVFAVRRWKSNDDWMTRTGYASAAAISACAIAQHPCRKPWNRTFLSCEKPDISTLP